MIIAIVITAVNSAMTTMGIAMMNTRSVNKK